MREALFRTDGDDGFGVRVELRAVARVVPVANRLAQARNALGHAVAVGVAALRGFYKLVDDVLRRGAIWVAHAKVDDVFAATTCGHF